MNNKIKILLLGVLCLTSFSCKPKNPNCKGFWDIRLKLHNKSGNNLYLLYSKNYPDTVVQNIPKGEDVGHSHYEAVSKNKIEVPCDWNEYYTNTTSGVVSFYIFLDPINVGEVNLDDVEFDINEIIKYPLLQRLDLTLNDLDSLNWLIIYP